MDEKIKTYLMYEVYNDAEECKLVKTFLTESISKKYDKRNVGLYSDNKFSVFKEKRGIKLEIIKKSLQKIFNGFGLETIAKCHLKITTYLDSTLNFTTVHLNLTTNQRI